MRAREDEKGVEGLEVGEGLLNEVPRVGTLKAAPERQVRPNVLSSVLLRSLGSCCRLVIGRGEGPAGARPGQCEPFFDAHHLLRAPRLGLIPRSLRHSPATDWALTSDVPVPPPAEQFKPDDE